MIPEKLRCLLRQRHQRLLKPAHLRQKRLLRRLLLLRPQPKQLPKCRRPRNKKFSELRRHEDAKRSSNFGHRFVIFASSWLDSFDFDLKSDSPDCSSSRIKSLRCEACYQAGQLRHGGSPDSAPVELDIKWQKQLRNSSPLVTSSPA